MAYKPFDSHNGTTLGTSHDAERGLNLYKIHLPLFISIISITNEWALLHLSISKHLGLVRKTMFSKVQMFLFFFTK